MASSAEYPKYAAVSVKRSFIVPVIVPPPVIIPATALKNLRILSLSPAKLHAGNQSSPPFLMRTSSSFMRTISPPVSVMSSFLAAFLSPLLNSPPPRMRPAAAATALAKASCSAGTELSS